jgi:hypothetical protein
MTTSQIALPTGSYVNADPRASTKRLVNVLSEISPQTAKADEKQVRPPITLRRWAGTTAFATDGTTNPVRGLWQMQGILYAVIGPILYSVTSVGVLTQVGQGISGSGFVRMSDNTACLFILIPSSTTGYTYTVAKGLQPFTDPVFLFYGAVDVWFVDSYFVFLSLGGRSFYNDDGQIVSGTGPPTFLSGAVFPREFGTDLFVGMAVDHREVLMFGQRTSEGYVNAGNPTFSPFVAAPDGFMQIGMHPDAAYSVALQDQSVFWVASDRTVRRRNGQTPIRVSNSGIESILEHANLKGSYALVPSIAGHPLWVYTMPNEAGGRTIVYDCLTTEWFELQSYNIGYWRALSYINVFGKQYIGDSLNGQIGYLDTSVFTEFGQPLVSAFTTQSVYDRHNRISHRRVELVMTPGGGTFTTNPQVTLYRSDDSGNTFLALPLRGLGLVGQRNTRTTWFNLGQSRDRVYKFHISDPSPTFSVDILADLDGGHW